MTEQKKAVGFYIWSNEHNAWWAHDGRGYVKEIEKAGKYTLDVATQTCLNANITGVINEVMVPFVLKGKYEA